MDDLKYVHLATVLVHHNRKQMARKSKQSETTLSILLCLLNVIGPKQKTQKSTIARLFADGIPRASE